MRPFFFARWLLADMSLSAFGSRDPMAQGPWRVMPDMLLMSTFKFSNPIQILILMEANNFSWLDLKLSLRLHELGVV